MEEDTSENRAKPPKEYGIQNVVIEGVIKYEENSAFFVPKIKEILSEG